MMSPILIVINAIFFIVPTSIPLRLLISPTICGALLCLPYRSREVANVTNLLPTPQLFSSYDPSQDQEDHPEPELSSDMLSSPSQINRWDLSSLLLGTEPFDSQEIVAFFRQPMCPSSDRSCSLILNPNSESFSSLISIASVCFLCVLLLLHFPNQLEVRGFCRSSISFCCCLVVDWIRVDRLYVGRAVKIITNIWVNT